MKKNNSIIRSAIPDDALALAELINLAGEGMPAFLWVQMAEPRESIWEVGQRRALRKEGGFSYLNGHCAILNNHVAACLIGYSLEKTTEPIDRETTPAMFVPLLELEALAADSWYINVLATYPEYQGRGMGTKLLETAVQRAEKAGKSALSLIVANANDGARRLYERFGFTEHARRRIVKENWPTSSTHWIMMIRP